MILFLISFLSGVALTTSVLFILGLPIIQVLSAGDLALFAINMYLLLGLIFSIDCSTKLAAYLFRTIFMALCVTIVVGLATRALISPQLLAITASLSISNLLFIMAHKYFSTLTPDSAHTHLLSKMLFILVSATLASTPFFFFASENIVPASTPLPPQNF